MSGAPRDEQAIVAELANRFKFGALGGTAIAELLSRSTAPREAILSFQRVRDMLRRVTRIDCKRACMHACMP